MGLGIPPLTIKKLVLVSNPLKSRISVRRLAVLSGPCSSSTTAAAAAAVMRWEGTK